MKQLCIKLVIVQDYTKMRGQHNVKEKENNVFF